MNDPHEAVDRSSKCRAAALGEELLESELFGHVRGASPVLSVIVEAGLSWLRGHPLSGRNQLGSASIASSAAPDSAKGTFEPVGSEETRTCDVRVLAAGNADLHQLVARGGFREDLLWRLAVVEVDIPSLSARMEDLPLLAPFVRAQHAHRLARRVDGFDASALDVLLSYTWPGNVRELEHAIARSVAVTRGPLISAVDLPPRIRRPQDTPAVQLAGACNRMNVNALKPLWPPTSRIEPKPRRWGFTVLRCTKMKRLGIS